MPRVHVSVCAFVASCCVSYGSLYRLRKVDETVSDSYLRTANMKGGGEKCYMGKVFESQAQYEELCLSRGSNRRHMFFGFDYARPYRACLTSPTCDVVEQYPKDANESDDVYGEYEDYSVFLTYQAACVAHWNKRKLDACDVYGNIRPDSCEDDKVWNGLNWLCEEVGTAWREHKPNGDVCVFFHEQSKIEDDLGCQQLAIRMGRPYYHFDKHCWTAWPCPTYETSPYNAPQGVTKYKYRPGSVSGSDHAILITKYDAKNLCLSSSAANLQWRSCEDEHDAAVEFLLPNGTDVDPTRVVGKIRLANQKDTCVNTTGTDDRSTLLLSSCDGARTFSMPSIGYSGLIYLGDSNETCINLYWSQVFSCIHATNEASAYWATIVGQ
eukprot:TRINITY_DN15718_c0_g1_i1.p1 TRINITY_DN15718_c0_g1~~TRINITY_DN15718_c0_g1_i1.p1  ORF type:complete len:392 (+),score=30.78 TRINITY_DN15718_c0_g1_i1:33-1178(+)